MFGVVVSTKVLKVGIRAAFVNMHLLVVVTGFSGTICLRIIICLILQSISLDKTTGKKSYMLCARELDITWSENSLYWSWKHLLQSRFAQVSELVMVCWLEISATINTRMLSANTYYGAFLVVKFANRAFGLDHLASEVLIQVGDSKYEGSICLCRTKSSDRIRERRDGWMEVEIGYFHTEDADTGKEVKMRLREVKGVHLKGGLIVEGIEVRPV